MTFGFFALIGVMMGSKFDFSSVPSKPRTLMPFFSASALKNSATPWPFCVLSWMMYTDLAFIVPLADSEQTTPWTSSRPHTRLTLGQPRSVATGLVVAGGVAAGVTPVWVGGG